ncbi:hypothetical protein T439DRAFT_358975 [Meredithblackwellia eburnea MCA 4105]
MANFEPQRGVDSSDEEDRKTNAWTSEPEASDPESTTTRRKSAEDEAESDHLGEESDRRMNSLKKKELAKTGRDAPAVDRLGAGESDSGSEAPIPKLKKAGTL